MFQNFDLLYIFGPAMVVGIIFLVIVNRRNKQNISPLNKAIDQFKNNSIVFGGLLVVLWLLLPVTPVLKTFGYPDNIFAITGEAKVLRLFQEYNKAIVRTTEILSWFLFLFIWWFLMALIVVAKAYQASNKKDLIKLP